MTDRDRSLPAETRAAIAGEVKGDALRRGLHATERSTCRGVPEPVIIASGFSCRHQIAAATGRRPVHFADALGRALAGSNLA